MKTNLVRKKQTKGFTLIEMIGVLAVIAILAALLIPKVFQAITEAKINTVPVGASTCKTGTVDHYAKYGALNITQGTNITTLPMADYDSLVLLVEGFIDKPFAPRVGSTSDVLLDAIPGTQVMGFAVTTADGTGYDLAGTGTLAAGLNSVTGSHVVYAIIEDVAIADAQAISARIDGAPMSQPEGNTGTDELGRVKYATGTTTDVYIYLTHR